MTSEKPYWEKERTMKTRLLGRFFLTLAVLLVLSTSCTCDMFYPEHLRPDCERAAVFDKSIILEDFSFAQGCGSVRGATRALCIEGDAYAVAYSHPAAGCRGNGPYRCRKGCRKDCHPIMELKALPFYQYAQPHEVCEENRPKRVGDECEDDEDCKPIITDILDEAHTKVVHSYLRCDTFWKKCVRTDPPHPIKDFMKSCGLHFSKKEQKEAPHTFVLAGRITDACDEKLCIIWSRDEKNSCIRQGCSRACRGADDCPQGTVCYMRSNLARIRGDQPRLFAGSCVPTGVFNLNQTFDWPCVPFKD